MARPTPPPRPPAARRLRVYAFDPVASLDLGSAKYSHATISLPWSDPTDGELKPGPVNDYLEIIDVDPCSKQFYPPVDLNAPELLAQDGLSPSEGDPRFHQQMVFAVVMKTIKLFERALGRKVIWAPTWDRKAKAYVPTRKLRVYPHALREANAYYSKEKRALLFGYFRSLRKSSGASWIFAALSHDIIVHETTHAILDGLHPRYAETTSPDSLAFHEAFADIAALLSHFQLHEAVYDFIDKQGGRLDEAGLLSGLAAQFAAGTSGRRSLREFLNKTPDPDLIDSAIEPHDRGAILVAAVFDAFLSIYTARTADLQRLSGERAGAGGRLNPDLTARLTKEAVRCADDVLGMCIRALDYLPPVDVRLGEFLRAIVTADTDLIPDDPHNYRLAFVQAFRRRGIFPDHCLSMSPDSLLWDQTTDLDTSDILNEALDLTPRYRRDDITRIAEENRRKVWYWLVQPELALKSKAQDADKFRSFLARARTVFAINDDPKAPYRQAKARNDFLDGASDYLAELGITDLDLEELKRRLNEEKDHFARWEIFFTALHAPDTGVKRVPSVDEKWEKALGIYYRRDGRENLYTIPGADNGLHVEVHSVRTTHRAGPDGQDVLQLVIEVTQRRLGFFDPEEQVRRDKNKIDWDKIKDTPAAHDQDFFFRGGATLIIDLQEGKLRYIISKRIDDGERLDQQRQFLLTATDMSFVYSRGHTSEPFAMLHRI